MKAHTDMLQSFARRLTVLLMLRGAVRWTTVWFFAWGVVVLASRIAGGLPTEWLSFGLLAAIPLAAAAALGEHRKRIAFSRIRAAYDGWNHCGGLIMAGEAAEMSAWDGALPRPNRPAVRWHGGRCLGLFSLSALFVAITLYLPDRYTTLAAPKPLEIGKLVGELNTEVETLKQEKILEDKKAKEIEKQLSGMKEQSSAADPNKTWEALDHIKEANSDLARQAAEEAVSKTSTLTEAQTLAAALEQASQSGLGRDTATRAAQDLAAMLKAARLEDGLLKGAIPADLLSNLNGLSKEDMEKLVSAIQANKSSLGRTVTNLANLKLIDPKMLGQCKKAGQCPNPNALAEFLCSSTNQCDSFCQAAQSYCRGGLDRGRGDAPMTWKDESSDQGVKFKEQVLPPSSNLSDAQFVGVSRSAPEVGGDAVVAEHGALANAQSSGGAAHSQVILPRHRQAVQRFFKREE